MDLNPADPTSWSFCAAVDAQLDSYLNAMADRLAPVSDDLPRLIDVAKGQTMGGKRLRPAFALWGWVAASPSGITTSGSAANSFAPAETRTSPV